MGSRSSPRRMADSSSPTRSAQWDAFVFETTGDLTTPGTDRQPPISADGEKAFYDAIRGGKGFIGMHCATDTFGHHRPAQQGCRRPLHPDDRRRVHHPRAQQESTIDVADPNSPASPRDSATRELVQDHRRMVRPEEPRRRSSCDHGPGHQGDEGPHVPAAQLSRSPGPGRTARAESSTPRWATAKTSGKTRCTRASCSAPSAGRPAASTPRSSPTSAGDPRI